MASEKSLHSQISVHLYSYCVNVRQPNEKRVNDFIFTIHYKYVYRLWVIYYTIQYMYMYTYMSIRTTETFATDKINFHQNS